jgi:GAF domain-containing protein
VPVISRSGDVYGGLFFGHPDKGFFTDRSKRIVEGLAGQAAIAMDNARLYEAAELALRPN